MSKRGPETPPPAWPKYARDWLTSEAVLAMPRAARSLYDDLLSFQWLNGSLPSEVEVLARMTGETVESFTDLWKHVSAQFEATSDGRLQNARMEEVRLEQRAYRDAKVAAGRLGAGKTNGRRSADTPAGERHSRTSADQSADALPVGHGAANGRPSSSSSSSVGNESPSRSTRAREGSPPDRPDVPTNVHDAFCGWWVGRYAEATASPAMPGGALYDLTPAERSKANELLAKARANGRGMDLVREVVERFIAHPTFGKEPPTLGRVLANWNSLVAAPASKASTSKPAVTESQEERDMRDRWFAVHSRLFGAVPEYPGHEAARARLDELATQKREKAPA